MSSLNKAIHRRNHRERGQPAARQNWGVLEKRKDYSLRAKDYNEKKKRLQILRQKVAQRHPEEFNFGMIRSQTFEKGRRIADRKAISLSQDTARLLKTQDAGYLNMVAQMTSVAKERLEQEYLMQVSINPERKDVEQGAHRSHHKYFFSSKSVQESFSQTREGKVRPALAGKECDGISRDQGQDRSSRLSSALRDQNAVSEEKNSLRRTWQREQKLRESRLKLLRKRQQEVRAASEVVGQQRVKMANTMGGVTTAGFKWKVRERKK